MSSLDEIRAARLAKLSALEAAGIDAYPVSTKRDMEIADAVKSFAKLEKGKKPKTIAGRIVSLRPQGGLAFFHLDDGSGKFQALLKKGEHVSDEDFDRFIDTTDVGDFVEVTGTFFVTKRGEQTIQGHSWRMLAKSLRPLPEKWHGLTDVEERFRRRYLDLISSPEVKARFVMRSRMVELIREFYRKEGYLEVDLPTFQTVAGGATAEPFITHHNALDTDFYLTIAQELYLKKLLIGGFTKVFEIGKRYRNEGIDTTHNPEFTMLESNASYEDALTQRDFIERLFRFVVKGLFGEMRFSTGGEAIDLEAPFAVYTFYELLQRFAHIPDPATITREDAALRAKQLGIDVAPTEALEKILDNIYKKTARPKLVQPTFIIEYPVSFNPFAKRVERDQSLIDRFQLVMGGVELVNAFSELNNPVDQLSRYKEQDKKGAEGEKEISPSDLEYVEAMEYGMPPNGGIGIGIDRLAMLFADVENIKEIILFPTMRPRQSE
jgi:lysyl-tRNA synthetase class 2